MSQIADFELRFKVSGYKLVLLSLFRSRLSLQKLMLSEPPFPNWEMSISMMLLARHTELTGGYLFPSTGRTAEQ